MLFMRTFNEISKWNLKMKALNENCSNLKPFNWILHRNTSPPNLDIACEQNQFGFTSNCWALEEWAIKWKSRSYCCCSWWSASLCWTLCTANLSGAMGSRNVGSFFKCAALSIGSSACGRVPGRWLRSARRFISTKRANANRSIRRSDGLRCATRSWPRRASRISRSIRQEWPSSRATIGRGGYLGWFPERLVDRVVDKIVEFASQNSAVTEV